MRAGARTFFPFIATALVLLLCLSRPAKAPGASRDAEEPVSIQADRIEPRTEPRHDRAVNSMQGFDVAFGPWGATFQAEDQTAGLELRAWGYEGRSTAVMEAMPSATAAGMAYRRGPLVERYVPDEAGLLQEIALGRAPAGVPAGRVAVRLACSGSLRPEVRGQELCFLDAQQETVLRYGRLQAHDARNRLLNTSMSLHGSELTLYVDAKGAQYPLTLEPLFAAQPLPPARVPPPRRGPVVLVDDDAFEENDSKATAAAPSTATRHEDLYCQDPDWYQFTVPEGAAIHATIYFTHSGASTDLDMILENDAGEIGRSESSTDNEVIQSGALAAGTYYLHVFGWNGAINSYDLQVFVSIPIALPEMLAIELPNPGDTAIADSAAPMSDLLAAASAGGLQITHDRSGFDFPLGGTPVTWTAWEGTPGASAVLGVKTAHVWVFPYGHTPLGITTSGQATAGGTQANNGTKVLRDADGHIHVAWLDYNASGEGHRILYRKGTQDQDTGAIAWSAPMQINTDATEHFRAFPAMALSANYLHFAWYGNGNNTVYYRRMTPAGVLDPIRTALTGTSNQNDSGAAIAVEGDDTIHIVGPRATRYARSADGGLNWNMENVPLPSGTKKQVALTVDPSGHIHILFTRVIRNFTNDSGYWEIYYLRRSPAGGWSDGHYALEDFPEWADLNDGNSDMLSDWPDFDSDASGNLHAVWHGSASTHQYGEDEAHYIRRQTTGPGAWGAWEQPISLYPVGEQFSFSPSLCLDDTAQLALPVIFHSQIADTTPADASFRVIRDGVLEGPPVALTQYGQVNLSTWYPNVCPRLYRHPNGRVWLDVFHTVLTSFATPDEPYFMVFQRHEITALINRPPGIASEPTANPNPTYLGP